jgi:hypothetical protein
MFEPIWRSTVTMSAPRGFDDGSLDASDEALKMLASPVIWRASIEQRKLPSASGEAVNVRSTRGILSAALLAIIAVLVV